MPINVKVSTSHPELPQLLLRQTPGYSQKWGDCQFYVNEHPLQYDWWFICHASALKNIQKASCDPGHLVYISMEASESACQDFYNQFSRLVVCEPRIKHSSILYRNGMTWWAGIKVMFENGHQFSPNVNHDYDSLSCLDPPVQKLNRVSIVTSDNNSLPGHKRRLDFIERLKRSEITNFIDIYGGGHNPVSDKIEAILPYKYHIALENSVVDHYWTEKIGDAFLGYALPLYHGCKNITSYFPSSSLLELDIASGRAIDQIKAAIEQDLYSQSLQAIDIARKRVLNDFNLFSLMASIATTKATCIKTCVLRPPEVFSPLTRKVLSKLKRTTQRWLA